MEQAEKETPARRSLLHICLFSSCLIAIVGYLLREPEWLDDVGDLTIQIAVLVALGGGAAAAWRAIQLAGSRVARRAFAAAAAGMVLLGGAFAYTNYADASVELASIVAKEQNAAETSVVLGPEGDDIRLSGDLTDGAAARLGALLDANPRVTRIHLTSEGGLAEEGRALAEVIAEHELTTFVPDFCVSACTLAFVGGRERLLMKNARLGFHAPYAEGLFGVLFQGDPAIERQAYVDAGVSPDFADKALKVASADMWFPSVDDLIDASVATGVVDRYRFPDSNLDGTSTLIGARAVITRSFPMVMALEAHDHHTLETAAAWYLSAYRRGFSEGLVADGLRAMIGGEVIEALAHADDPTLYGLARYLDGAMRTIQLGAPQRCVEIGENADLVAAAYLRERLQADNSSAGADEAAVLVTKALQSAATDTGEVEVGRSVNVAKPSSAACQDVIGAYDELLRMSTADAASEIRPLLKAHVHASGTASAIAERTR